MVKIFFDANFYISLVEQRTAIDLDYFKSHILFVSPLSIAILTYLYKYQVPNQKLITSLDDFHLVTLDQEIIYAALDGPTSDLEDNIQLHSAFEAECDLFLTEDKRLLSLKFFGKLKIISNL
ncbi:type II toxin-antitoxin system VapC family toxin [Candidatus Daviesbacteria bacterium]|nr:type II toxin-antitoxin system VapC family toxin [Candidatus Daviesbacteria bacterium]